MASRRKQHQLLIAATRGRIVPAATGARLRERDPKERRCARAECGRAFKPHREWQKFCGDRCRYIAWDEENPRVRIRRAR